MKITIGVLLFIVNLFGVQPRNIPGYHLHITKPKLTVHAKKNLEFAAKQLRYAADTYPDPDKFPRSVHKDGTIDLVSASDWTSGFFPGELWLIYKFNHKSFFKDKAEAWTSALKSQQFNTSTHDVGFMMNCSYGNGLLLTHNKEYKKILIQSARSLASRFNPVVGAIKSWNNTKWKYPVIMDNMMNLELLFRATQLTGDSTFYKIAVTHATTSMRTHVRSDGSTYHLVDFNPKTGKVIWKGTVQGYANNSTWARGEAWALYGFTMVYRFTKQEKFLKEAEKIAHFILTNKNLPPDYVPYWDYNAPNIPNAPRDASAAAIMSSAFIELSGYVHGNFHNEFLNAAKHMINSLSSPKFRAKSVGANHGFILKRGVGNKPADSEVTVPLVYGDYYYVEANLRYLDLMRHK